MIIEPLSFNLKLHAREKESCSNCNGICVKNGLRYTQFGSVQRFRCKTCGSTHSNSHFKRKYPNVIKVYAIELYKEGASLADAQKAIKEKLNVSLSRTIILRWLIEAEVPRRHPKPKTKFEKKESKDRIEFLNATKLKLLVSIKVVFEDNIITEFIETSSLIQEPFILEEKVNK